MSISSEISRLTQAKSDIKTAIESKGVTVPSSAKLDDYHDYIDDIEQGSTPNLQSKSVSITENGTTTVEPDPGYDGLSEVGVSVNVQGGGGSGASEDDDVRFIDYDGTLLYSYSANDFLALTSMPENPTHDGLISQGWNWTLTEAKEQVSEMGTCDIGQMYITESGDTEIDVMFDSPERLSPFLTVAVNGTIVIDWGDGSSVNELTGTSLTERKGVFHKFLSTGKYTISIHVISGTFTFFCDRSYYILRKSTTENENKVYANHVSAIRLGSGITTIGQYAFAYCFSLEYVTLPQSITSIGERAFGSSNSIKSLTIPHEVVSIGGYLFSYIYSLRFVSFPPNLTNIPDYTFQSCMIIKRITLSRGISNIGKYAFASCQCLRNLKLPQNVSKIDKYTFQNCYSLVSFTVPQNISSIEDYAFANCSGIAKFQVLPLVPPTIGGSNAISTFPSDCKIYVPAESLSEYKTATYWRTHASKMVGE